MAFVSQCSNCSTLTMMDRCPKCGGSTKPYEGGPGATKSPSRALSYGSSGATTVRPTSVSNGRAKQFAAPAPSGGLQGYSTSVHSDIEALQEQLQARDRELAALRSASRQQQQQQQHHQVSPPQRHHNVSPSPVTLHSSNGLVASTQQELASAWSQHVQERQSQTDVAALREKYSSLLSEKDRWTAEKLRLSEEHHKVTRQLEDQLRDARSEAQHYQSKIAEGETHLVEVQRKHFESEQLVHSYAQRMQVATDEVRELQRAVSSSKEADRRELERARADTATHSRRLAELEDELKHLRLRMADVKDELEATTALRASLSQKFNTVSVERDQLEESKHSLERQLSLAGVEQHALAQETRVLREKLLEGNARIETLEIKKHELAEELRELRDARLAAAAATSNSSEVATLRSQLEAASAEVGRMTRERQAAIDAAEAMRSEIRRINSSNDALDHEITHARSSNELLAKELSTLRGEIRVMGQEFQALQASQLATYQKHSDELRVDLRRAEGNAQSAMEQVERVQRDGEIMRAAHEKTRSELKATIQSLEAEMSKKTQELDRAQSELQRKQSLSPTRVANDATLAADRIANLNASIERQQKSIQDARAETDDIRRELDDTRRNLVAARASVTSLDDIISATIRETGNICTREELPLAVRAFARERNLALEDKEHCVAKADREHATMRDEISDLRSEVHRLGAEAEKSHQRAVTAESESRRRQVEWEHALKEERSRIESQSVSIAEEGRIQALRAAQEIRNLEAALRGVQELHAATEERLRSAEAENRRLLEQTQQADDRHASHSKNLDSARSREAELVRLLQQEQAKAETARNVESDLRDQIQLLRSDNIKLRRDTDTAAQMLASALEEERRIQEADRERLDRELEQARVQLRLERDRRSLESDVTRSAESRCHELEVSLESIKLERDQLRREHTTMRGAHKATNDAFQARVGDLEAQGREQDSQVRDLVERLSMKEREAGEATARALEFEKRLQQLEHEKDGALRKLDHSSRRIQPTPLYATSDRYANDDGRNKQHGATNSTTTSVASASLTSSRRVQSPPRDIADRRQSSEYADPAAPAGYFAPPSQQSPVPMPAQGSRVVSSGLSARERNDALLAQFREQRALSSGSSSLAAPLLPQQHQRAPSQSSSAGVRLGSLRR
ncbi:kinesin K39, putative [Bodo saltans]|uniref:Kinesin K39, putative n=1 Tax=Bodo saltans TaxID=75058 RepID=A0A0S4IX85_BODSA|nr:kinesin K39, putative [Bodo saltans]|eukprot:CUG03066.1 kinesin K39, putative [Bodo saltans]